MAKAIDIDMRGVHVVGKYHYAWRGGPRIKADPGTAAYKLELQRRRLERDEGQEPPKAPKETFQTVIDSVRHAVVNLKSPKGR